MRWSRYSATASLFPRGCCEATDHGDYSAMLFEVGAATPDKRPSRAPGAHETVCLSIFMRRSLSSWLYGLAHARDSAAQAHRLAARVAGMRVQCPRR